MLLNVLFKFEIVSQYPLSILTPKQLAIGKKISNEVCRLEKPV